VNGGYPRTFTIQVVDRYNRQSNLISRSLNVRKGEGPCPHLVILLLESYWCFFLASLVYSNMKPVVINNHADYLSIVVQPNVYDLLRNRTSDEKGR
jgi:hypothetical protein